jgi:hypothetical protein
MIIALCGSLSLGDEFMRVKGELERLGHSVLVPESLRKFELHTAEDVVAFKSERTDYLKIKPAYMRDHFDKIARSDAILVVNMEKKGIRDYVGGNTFAEVMVAFYLEKKIFFMNPLPEHERLEAFREELKCIQPVVLNGNLSLIS